MYRYKNILVGLNLTEQDDCVIRYAGLISRMANSKNAYFVHVNTSEEIPAEIQQNYPELAAPLTEHMLETWRFFAFDENAKCEWPENML